MKKLIATALGVALALTATVALAGRNSSGTMSFTSVAGGYPFQSGQTISSAGVNSNFSELATELSDSLSRSGKGGMSAPLRCADGTAAAPAFSWTSDTNTGFYRPAADTIGVSLAGTDYLDFASTRIWSHLNLEFSGASDRFVVQSGSARLFVGTSSGNNSDVGIQRNGTVMLGFTSTIEANSNRITGVGTPSAATDAATKAYVDALFSTTTVAAGSDWTLSTNTVAKAGNVVSVLIAGTVGGSGAWSTVATVPSGYRPAAGAYIKCRVGDSSPSANYVGLALVAPDTGVMSIAEYDNGTGLVAPFTIGSGDAFWCSGSYPTP